MILVRSLFIFFIFSLLGQGYAEVERRLSVDVGSGGTKIAIADVETDTNQIIEVVLDASYPVPYQASLDKSEDGTFDKDTLELGLKTFEKIKELANEHQVKKIAAVATSAFRKSNNSREFVADVKAKTGIQIQIIPQREEGEIAFFSALATGSLNPDEIIVWDIGTGSLQMTAKTEQDALSVYMGEHMGSQAFKSYIIDTIQDKEIDEINTPNPMTEEDLKDADKYARAFARKAYPVIKQKIKDDGKIVGIGRLFFNSIRPIASENGVITRKALRSYIDGALNKTDDELNNPFAHVDVSNCILTLAIMKALHIHAITPVETTSTKGLLISPLYWN